MITSLLVILSLSSVSATGQEAQEAAPQTEDAVISDGPELALDAPAEQPFALQGYANTYAAFHSDVSEAGRRELNSVLALDETMDSLAAYYTDDRLVDAQIAYAALVAAQHPEFIDSVRAISDYYGADVTAASLMNDPVFVTGFMGADAASENVVGALSADNRQIDTVAVRYREAAYDLQGETWARARALDRRTRLDQIESGSVRLQTPFTMAQGANGARLGAASDLFCHCPDRTAP